MDGKARNDGPGDDAGAGADESGSLLSRLAQGDAGAIEGLLERHLPRLRAYVRSRMGPELRAKESASDLVQSTCREVLEHLDRFQYGGEANFRHWLFATALRKVQKRAAYYRAARRDVGREEREPSDPDRSLAACYRTLSTPSGRVSDREQIAKIEAAMGELSEDHREVILLSRVVGLPHREVAQAMGKTELATRSLLHRALAQLAAALLRH